MLVKEAAGLRRLRAGGRAGRTRQVSEAWGRAVAGSNGFLTPPSRIEATLSRFRHQVRICCHGGHIHLAYKKLVGPEGEITDSRAQFREYEMRDSPPPHPARLTSSSAKHSPLSTVSVPKTGIFEVPA